MPWWVYVLIGLTVAFGLNEHAECPWGVQTEENSRDVLDQDNGGRGGVMDETKLEESVLEVVEDDGQRELAIDHCDRKEPNRMRVTGLAQWKLPNAASCSEGEWWTRRRLTNSSSALTPVNAEWRDETGTRLRSRQRGRNRMERRLIGWVERMKCSMMCDDCGLILLVCSDRVLLVFTARQSN